MKQKLLPQSIRKTIPPLYAQDGKGMEAIAHLRFFSAYSSNGVWYLTEFDHDGGDTCFGWAEILPGCGELGYFSLSELESLEARINGRRIPGLQAIERDIHFTPTPLSQIPEIKRRNQ